MMTPPAKKLKSIDIISKASCSLCNESNSGIQFEKLIEIEDALARKLMLINYGPKVEFIYNPLDYAKELHVDFTRRFCNNKKNILMIGMNPGPWGMCQTGVPFGEVSHVKDWLKVKGNVNRPNQEHKDRPVLGLDCKRKEVSGDRLWSLLEELSGEPEILFRHIFLTNYCPLAYLATSGKNVTPVELKIAERKPLEEACDAALLDTVKLLNAKYLVCIGNYVVMRAKKMLQKAELSNDIKVVTLMHPSPASPAANKGWSEIAMKQLRESGLLKYFNCDKINETGAIH